MDKFDLGGMLDDTLDFDAITASIVSDTEDDELARYEFASSLGEDVDDVDFTDPEIAPDFEEFLSDHTRERVGTAFDDLLDGLEMDGDRVRIWRSIMVSPEWIDTGIHERPLGVFWSFDRDAAECHWGDYSAGKVEIRLEGLVDPGDVDWDCSVYCNTRFPEEKEVHLKDSALVEVVAAVWVSAGEPARIAAGTYPASDETAPADVPMAA